MKIFNKNYIMTQLKNLGRIFLILSAFVYCLSIFIFTCGKKYDLNIIYADIGILIALIFNFLGIYFYVFHDDVYFKRSK